MITISFLNLNFAQQDYSQIQFRSLGPYFTFEHGLRSHLSYVMLDVSLHLYLEQVLEFFDHFLIFDEEGILDFHCMTMLPFMTLQ